MGFTAACVQVSNAMAVPTEECAKDCFMPCRCLDLWCETSSYQQITQNVESQVPHFLQKLRGPAVDSELAVRGSALLSGIHSIIWCWDALFPTDTVWVFCCTCGLPFFRTLLLLGWELVCSVSACFIWAGTALCSTLVKASCMRNAEPSGRPGLTGDSPLVQT